MPEEPVLPIDDPRLKQASTPVEHIDDGVRELAEDMFAIMDRANGAGLAAVQIGVSVRLVVMDVTDTSGTRHRLALVNPELTSLSEETAVNTEGCLSMPGYELPVSRSVRAAAAFTDLDGNRQEIRGDGQLAVCLQHEIDHTNGILFTDRVSGLRRERARAYFAKARRQHERRH